jgi:hypothetical protein
MGEFVEDMKKIMLFIGFLFFIFIPSVSFAELNLVPISSGSGYNLYSFTTDCTNEDIAQTVPQGIILPSNPASVNEVFFHFHGYESENTRVDRRTLEILCTGQTEACSSASNGNIAIVLFLKPNLHGEANHDDDYYHGQTPIRWSENNPTAINCVLDQVKGYLQQLRVNAATYNISGHSAGGKGVANWSSHSNTHFNKSLLLDACYTQSDCNLPASHVDSTFVYYSDQGGTGEFSTQVKNDMPEKVTLVHAPYGHSDVPAKCFLDYTKGTTATQRCSDNNGILIGDPASALAEFTGNTESNIAWYNPGDETQLIIQQPLLKIKIPGLTFSSADVDSLVIEEPDGSKYISIPFLGEYLSAVYRYSLAAMGIIAIIMIIVSGIQWMLPTGQDNITAAKKRILGAITGLLIASSSYIILYTINPELVRFQNLKIQIIPSRPYGNDEPTAPSEYSNSGSATAGTLLCSSVESCQPYCNGTLTVPAAMQGMADPTALVPLSDYTANGAMPGISTGDGVRILPSLLPPLRAAGSLASADGYSIYVRSGYRSLQEQLTIICNAINENGTVDSSLNAWPGGSKHGTGIAIDVVLQQNGNDVTSRIVSATQNNFPRQNHFLADFMYRAGWMRLRSEIWHFEYPADPNNTTRVINGCYDTSC